MEKKNYDSKVSKSNFKYFVKLYSRIFEICNKRKISNLVFRFLIYNKNSDSYLI